MAKAIVYGVEYNLAPLTSAMKEIADSLFRACTYASQYNTRMISKIDLEKGNVKPTNALEAAIRNHHTIELTEPFNELLAYIQSVYATRNTIIVDNFDGKPFVVGYSVSRQNPKNVNITFGVPPESVTAPISAEDPEKRVLDEVSF